MLREFFSSKKIKTSNEPVFNNARTSFVKQNVFDLHNLNLDVDAEEFRLTSMPFGHGSNKNEPQIQSFLIKNGIALEPQSAFLNSTNSALNSQPSKKITVVDEPVYVLPYYTNQFGHFTGEILSGLITFLKILPPNVDRQLFVICPNEFDSVISTYGKNKKWMKFDSPTALEFDIKFTNAIPLPRLGPWQNIVLGQRIFGNLNNPGSKHERVFLTSERSSRISNISDVIAMLRNYGFHILNSRHHSFEHNVSTLRDAKHLLSEHGSIIHNILFGRTQPYTLFCAKNGLKLTDYEFSSGGFYAMLHLDLISYFPCDVANKNIGDHHPWANQLVIDTLELQNYLEALD